MKREALEKCVTMEECIGEIIEQNVKTKESVCAKYKNRVEKKEGFYLEFNNEKNNSEFDCILFGLGYAYTKAIEANIDGNHSEFLNDSIWDSFEMSYRVLLDWVNGKYWNIYTPTNVEELVEIVFDYDKGRNVTNYLFGVVRRLAKNLLSCSAKENNNNFTVNPRKYSRHINNNKNQSWEYYYVRLDSIDEKKENDNDNKYSSNLKNNILDQFLYEQNLLPDILETNEKNVNGYLDAICQFYTDFRSKEIRALFDDDVCIDFDDKFKKFSNVVRINSNQQCKKNTSRFNIKFEKNGIYYAGDFIDFSFKLMHSHDLLEKFNMIKKAMNRNDYVGDLILDLVLSLDADIYRQFFQHLNDSRCIKYYVKSDNFELILNTILNEYRKQQERFKDIYVYNETQRKKKIEKLKNKLMSLQNDNVITMTKINVLYKDYVEEFGLNNMYTNNRQLNMYENKIDAINNLGFDIEKIGTVKYVLKNIC